MHLDIPAGRALVYPVDGQSMRFVYRDGAGQTQSRIVPVPAHLRGPLALVSSVRIDLSRKVPAVEVPVLAPAHTVRLAWAGGIETILHGGDRPDRVRVERMPLRAPARS